MKMGPTFRWYNLSENLTWYIIPLLEWHTQTAFGPDDNITGERVDVRDIHIDLPVSSIRPTPVSMVQATITVENKHNIWTVLENLEIDTEN